MSHLESHTDSMNNTYPLQTAMAFKYGLRNSDMWLLSMDINEYNKYWIIHLLARLCCCCAIVQFAHFVVELYGLFLYGFSTVLLLDFFYSVYFV